MTDTKVEGDLRVKHGYTAEQARKHSSLGLVYKCPICKVGHNLRTFSQTTGEVECTKCGKIWRKP